MSYKREEDVLYLVDQISRTKDPLLRRRSPLLLQGDLTLSYEDRRVKFKEDGDLPVRFFSQ